MYVYDKSPAMWLTFVRSAVLNAGGSVVSIESSNRKKFLELDVFVKLNGFPRFDTTILRTKYIFITNF